MSQTAARLDVSHYAYRVVWSVEDQEFVATCAELPSLSWLDADQVAALQGLKALVGEVVADLTEHGESVPEPLVERSFSGKLNLRLGSELHRQVARDAAEAGMSINTWVVCRVS